MNEKAIEEYKTLEEATNRARELNGIIKLDNGCLSNGTYAYHVKISRNNGKRIFLVIKNEDFVARKDWSELKEKTIKQIIEMREQGATYQAIAKKIGTNPTNVHKWYKQAKERLWKNIYQYHTYQNF